MISFLELEIPVIFSIHSNNPSELKNRIEALSSKREADYIFDKLDFEIGIKRYIDKKNNPKRHFYFDFKWYLFIKIKEIKSKY